MKITTIVTTVDYRLFEMFYKNKYHNIFTEDLYLYVDLEDVSQFKELVDCNKVKVFSKKELNEYYQHSINNDMKTFNKVFFINMLLNKNLINDGFYFTDDDVLAYDYLDEKDFKSRFFDLENFDITKNYTKWTSISNWINKHYIESPIILASNFYVPKSDIKDLKELMSFYFEDFMELITNELHNIKKKNLRSNSKRGMSTNVFLIDTLFLNVLFSNLGIDKETNIKRCAKANYPWVVNNLHRLKDGEDDIQILIKRILESTTKKWPELQPIWHFNVLNKLDEMTEFYRTLNNLESLYKTPSNLLKGNEKEMKIKMLF